MNFLAHAYLSFGYDDIIAGNMISDFIKGSARYNFPPAIQCGIELHRRIDSFTDSHPATQEAKLFFKPHYRLYSAPIVDILMDHFLANDKSEFEQEDDLENFTKKIYAVLEKNVSFLPPHFVTVFTYMKMENWLYNYRLRSGMEKSLRGLVRRSSFITDSSTAYKIFEEHYESLQQCYQSFFKDVKQFAKQQLQELL